MIGSGQVLPVYAAADENALARVRRFNRARIEEAIDEGRQDCWLASPLAGSSIRVGLMEMLIYEIVAEQPAAALSLATIRSGALALMNAQGMSINRDASDAVTDGELNREIEDFIAEKLPMWQRVGLL